MVVSDSSDYIAIVSGSRVAVRDTVSLTIINVYSCVDKIEKCEFSPDSCYLYCAMLSRSSIQVFSIADSSWKCRITEGVAGVINVAWAPDSRSIITESDFGIQLTIWSLIDSTSNSISHPKQPFYGGNTKSFTSPSLFSFSDCGKYMSVVHRIDVQDHIGIYSTDPWSELSKFRCKSNDVAVIQWTPHGTHIVTVDSPLNYRVCVYTPSGEIIANYEAYVNALGVRSLHFYRNISVGSSSLAMQLLAVASFDGKVRFLTMQSWQVSLVFPLTHPRDMDAGLLDLSMENGGSFTTACEVLESAVDMSILEVTKRNTGGGSNNTMKGSASKYVRKVMKVLPYNSCDVRDSKSLPPSGVSWFGWSADGLLCAGLEESFPRCIWVWEGLKARAVDLLVQLDTITCARWRPVCAVEEKSVSGISTSYSAMSLLAFCTGSSRIYFWTVESGPFYADLPPVPSSDGTDPAAVRAPVVGVSWLKWSNDGRRLIVGGRESFCTCDVTFAINDTSTSTDSPIKTVLTMAAA